MFCPHRQQEEHDLHLASLLSKKAELQASAQAAQGSLATAQEQLEERRVEIKQVLDSW